jgi:hypothetical protein
MTETAQVDFRRCGGRDRVEVPAVMTPWPLRVAYVFSALVVVATVASSILGLFVDGLYKEGPWAAEAFRGGDLVTLVVTAPLLVVSLVQTVRGSRRWPAIWIGMFGYSVYNYAFYVFGASFNDAFLLHIAAMSMSLYGIALALPTLDWRSVGERLRLDRWAGWIGGILIAVGALQGAAWIALIVRNALTGEVLQQIPVRGQHLVFALDLTLMMPALVIAGVLLVRRTAIGFLLATAVAFLGAVYSLNGNAAAWFQAHAGVAGAQAVSPTNVVITVAMFVPAAWLWLGTRRAPKGRDRLG